ncbi:cyclophilin-like fold protein [Danxiaibacter flavus]|uniref:Cyclophilin-like fold protein n=1 Tax=Danxiaibacter flavus TaxID=3049108 RepID=A0ABV3ZJ24_9BACT|nr:cyclophilin-like fold protein [Chitinophagaceae bacterium DXS]
MISLVFHRPVRAFAIVSLVCMVCSCKAYTKDNESAFPEYMSTDTLTHKMKVTIGSQTFTALLSDNPASAALIAALPLTLVMTELNGNEKYAKLPNALPAAPANPSTIQAGDLMLWGNNTLVLFYKSFSTSYSYTRIGRIDDVRGLFPAVGSKEITVTFSVE